MPGELSGMFRRSPSLAIPHRKSFAAIPSVSLALLGHTNRNVLVSHTNRSVKLPSFRHFQDRFLTTNRKKRREENGPLFRKVCVFLTFCGLWAFGCDSNLQIAAESHDAMPKMPREGWGGQEEGKKRTRKKKVG